MGYFMYVCPVCKKIFKVNGTGKLVKCNNCQEKLCDMSISQDSWEIMSKSERSTHISKIVNKEAEIVQDDQETKENSAKAPSSNKYVFCCPECRTFEKHNSIEQIPCAKCGKDLICLKLTETVWAAMSTEEKKNIIAMATKEQKSQPATNSVEKAAANSSPEIPKESFANNSRISNPSSPGRSLSFFGDINEKNEGNIHQNNDYITCPECNKRIERGSITCPQCGYPINGAPNRKRRDPVKVLLIAVSIIAAICIVGEVLYLFNIFAPLGTGRTVAEKTNSAEESNSAEKSDHEHTLTEATCTEPAKCTVCGEIVGEPLGHTTDCGKCTRCGVLVNKEVLDKLAAELNAAIQIMTTAAYQVTFSSIGTDETRYDGISGAISSYKQAETKLNNVISLCGDYELFKTLKTDVTAVKNTLPTQNPGNNGRVTVSQYNAYLDKCEANADKVTKMATTLDGIAKKFGE